MFCEEADAGGISFTRQNILQVRLEHPVKSAFLGAVVGAGTGTAMGAALANGRNPDPEAQVYYPLFLGIVSGVFVAKIVGHRSVLHGKVVYRH